MNKLRTFSITKTVPFIGGQPGGLNLAVLGPVGVVSLETLLPRIKPHRLLLPFEADTIAEMVQTFTCEDLRNIRKALGDYRFMLPIYDPDNRTALIRVVSFRPSEQVQFITLDGGLKTKRNLSGSSLLLTHPRK